jgi:hypothetical protein
MVSAPLLSGKDNSARRDAEVFRTRLTELYFCRYRQPGDLPIALHTCKPVVLTQCLPVTDYLSYSQSKAPGNFAQRSLALSGRALDEVRAMPGMHQQ